MHTEYSLLDGAIKVVDLIDRVEKLGQKAVAITDHGVLFGAVKFQQAAQKKGIRSIIGFEGYVATGDSIERPAKSGGDNFHITLLAANREGYFNLMRLSSIAHLRGLSYKPRIDLGLLSLHSAGLIVLSGCVGAEIPQLIVSGRAAEAEKLATRFRDELAGRFFIEVMAHGSTGGIDHVTVRSDDDKTITMSETDLNTALVDLANKLGVGVVATNDAHYLERRHGSSHDSLLCIGMGSYKEEKTRMRFPGSKEKAYEFYIKTETEMLAASGESWWPTAVANTAAVSDMVADEVVPLGVQVLPKFQIPDDPSYHIYKRTGLLV